MSWIKDVKADLADLDLSGKSLRRFGWLVGSVLFLLGAFFYYKKISLVWVISILVAALPLLLLSLAAPRLLRRVYTVWMALAFLIGWIISRVLLSFIFYLIIAPIGVMTKILGKRFLEVKINPQQKSYWVKKKKSNPNYEKMY